MLGRRLLFAFLGLLLIAGCGAEASPPKVVILVGEEVYGSEASMRSLAAEFEERLGFEVEVRYGPGRQMPEPPDVEEADLLVLFLRFREPSEAQLNKLDAWLDAGKPAITLRTTSHAFWGEDLKGWFPPRFGGHFKGHAHNGAVTEVAINPRHFDHPIFQGIPSSLELGNGGVYISQPLAEGAQALMFARIGDLPAQPVVWTFSPVEGQRLFSTSLGTEENFEHPEFHCLMANAALWCLGQDIPVEGAAGFENPEPSLNSALTRNDDALEWVAPEPLPLTAPANAEVLFDGNGLDAWRHWDASKEPIAMKVLGIADTTSGGEVFNQPRWTKDGKSLVARPGFGDLLSVEDYSNYRLHLDFMIPPEANARPASFRGGSGVYLSGLYEIQISDSNGTEPSTSSCGAVNGLIPPAIDAARPAGVWQSLEVQFEHAMGESPFASVWLNGVLVQDDVELDKFTSGAFLRSLPGASGGDAGERFATEIGEASSKLAWGESDFAVATRFRTEGNGSLVSKCPPEGKWAPDAKVLFLRDGHLVYDIGWVGAQRSSNSFNDGEWHNTVLRQVDSEVQLYVDGELEFEESGFLKPDHEGFVLKVGAANQNFGGSFEGEIEQVLFFARAITEEEAKSWSVSGEFESEEDFLWEKKEGQAPFVPFVQGAPLPGPLRLQADSAEVRFANIWIQPLDRIDHAGLISGLDDDALERGRALYMGTCVACHGPDGSNTATRAFVSSPLENGNDPLSLYNTIQKGFRNMPSNAWLSTEKTYDVVHFIREEFFKQKNPEQYFQVDPEYLASLPRGNRHAAPDKDELIVRDWGPVLATQLGDDIGSALTVRLTDEVSLAYDLQRMISPAVWQDGFLQLAQTQHYLQRGEGRARVQGNPISTLANFGWGHDGTLDWDASKRPPRGPLPKSWLDYHGHYLHNRDVVLSYAIDGREILEQPGLAWADEMPVILHRYRIEAGQTPLLLQLGTRDMEIEQDTVETQESFEGINELGWRAISVRPIGASSPFTAAGIVGADLPMSMDSEGRLTLNIPATEQPLEFLLLRCASKSDAGHDDFLQLMTETYVSELPESPSALTSGGPARWPMEFKTTGELGQQKPYALDTIHLPESNPWNAWIRTSALDFFENGDVAVSTYGGDVWIVSGINDDLKEITWRRFAAGMFEPMGLKIVDGLVYVTCRDRITRLHDLNNDGEADFYESFFADPDVSPNFHAFNFDLQQDAQGNLYYSKSGQYTDFQLPGAIIKVAPDGKSHEVHSTGLRTPNGMGMSPDGRPLVSDNQGNWIPASKVSLAKEGGFYGVFKSINTSSPGKQNRPDFDQPAIWMPQRVDSSSGGQLWVDDPRFGPLSGQYLHTSFGKGWMYGLTIDADMEPSQGAVWKLPFQFDAGLQRLRINPADGQVYTVGLSGWQGPSGGADGCLQRVRWTDEGQPLLIRARAVEKGVELKFSAAIDPALANDASNFTATRWNYAWARSYGSEHYSVKQPGEVGQDDVAISSTRLLDDGRTILVELDHVICNQLRVEFKLFPVDHEVDDEVHLTVNRLPTES